MADQTDMTQNTDFSGDRRDPDQIGSDRTAFTRISGDVLDDDRENARRLASMDVAFTTTDAVVRPKIRLPKAERRALKAVPSAVRRQRAEKSSVLFDEPGPRARRRIRVLNVVGVVVMLGLLAWLLFALANPPSGQNQLAWKLWEPALNASAWRHTYLPGLASTLGAALVAIAGSLVFGFLFALGRLSRLAPLKWLCAVVVEFCRAVPVLLFMIFLWRFFAGLGWGSISAFWAVVWGLILYNSSVIAELLRSGVGNLPRGQEEAAVALGMGHMHGLVLVLLPQALRAVMPSLVSQLVVVVKDTALGSIVTYTELLQRSRQLGSAHFDPLQTIFVAGVIYFLVCLALSRVAESLPQRMQKKTSGVAREQVQAPIAILDPSNLNQQERANQELPLGGAEPLIPDHYHGSNAKVTSGWRTNHMEMGHDAAHTRFRHEILLPRDWWKHNAEALWRSGEQEEADHMHKRSNKPRQDGGR